MKRVHYAILFAQALSYCLMIVFIFADTKYSLTGVFMENEAGRSLGDAVVLASLVALVGTVNLWLTWFYAAKSHAMRDMVVVCSWTRRIKRDGGWISMEEFFEEELGLLVSHGLSDRSLVAAQGELDRDWRKLKRNVDAQMETRSEKPKEIGMYPRPHAEELEAKSDANIPS